MIRPASDKIPQHGLAAAVVALGALIASHGSLSAQVSFTATADAEVTYAGNVAPILQNSCMVCHRPGGIGPMNLVTYDDARRYARRIREQVINRLMPPYYYDRDVGIQELQHDWRLSEDEINTVVAWVDQGAPLGDPAEIPPPPRLPDTDDWSFAPILGEPDVIVPSTPIDVPADGLDLFHFPYVPTGVTEDRCISALQVKPRGDAKTVVHHANSTFQLRGEDGLFVGASDSGAHATEYAMGKLGELVPDGVCRVLPKDAWVRWDIHLYPGGLGSQAPGTVIEDNVVELGIWLHPADYEYDYVQDLQSYSLPEGELLIPPSGTAVTQGFQVWDHPVRIDSFQPHGHLRLRAASLEILYPDTGETEIVSMISNWSAVWHQSHIYEPDAAPLLPAGAMLIMKQWYDNTADNPNVTDPRMWVEYGSRTADEMSHTWIAVTHLDEEGYQKLLAERKARAERSVTQ